MRVLSKGKEGVTDRRGISYSLSSLDSNLSTTSDDPRFVYGSFLNELKQV